MEITIFNDDAPLVARAFSFQATKKTPTFNHGPNLASTFHKDQLKLFTVLELGEVTKEEAEEAESFFCTSNKVISVNLVLNLTRYMLEDEPLNFVNATQADRNGGQGTVNAVQEFYEAIHEADAPLPDDFLMDSNLTKEVISYVDRIGMSDFKERALNALTLGSKDFCALVYSCYLFMKEERETLNLPRKPFDFECEKQETLPATFIIRSIKTGFSFYGPSGFLVCESPEGEGICFDMNPSTILDSGLSRGDLIEVRGSYKGLSSNKRWQQFKNVRVQKLSKGF